MLKPGYYTCRLPRSVCRSVCRSETPERHTGVRASPTPYLRHIMCHGELSAGYSAEKEGSWGTESGAGRSSGPQFHVRTGSWSRLQIVHRPRRYHSQLIQFYSVFLHTVVFWVHRLHNCLYDNSTTSEIHSHLRYVSPSCRNTRYNTIHACTGVLSCIKSWSRCIVIHL